MIVADVGEQTVADCGGMVLQCVVCGLKVVPAVEFSVVPSILFKNIYHSEQYHSIT